MKRFSYIDATAIKHTTSALQAGDSVIVAGGTDILNVLKNRSRPKAPRSLIDIKGIPGLDKIEEDGGCLKIGALTTLSDIAESDAVKAKYPMLAEAAHAVASPQIRNMGTLGGNICQETRCWYYRYPDNTFHCFRKGGNYCPALTGQNRFHSIFGVARVAAPPCRVACPGHVDIPGVLGNVRAGALELAATLLLERNPIPAITGRVCPHFCQQGCNRKKFDSSVSIRNVERFLGDVILDKPGDFYRAPTRETGRRVAIVGSGPAALAAAYDLRKRGHQVVVFESRDRAGGMLNGIPKYRLPREVLDRVIGALERMGIRFVLNMRIGRDVPLKTIRNDYDGVVLATGMWGERAIGLKGEQLATSGISLLTEGQSAGARVSGKSILVIGGGNVAMDVAVTAKRLGAKDVTVVCLERREEMPAFKDEIDQAIEEGVTIAPSWGPVEIRASGSKAKVVSLVRCASVFDAQRKFSPSFDPSVTEERQADEVFLAVGLKADLSYLDKEAELATARGLIAIQIETQQTNVPGLYAAGDVTSGPGSVIQAIAAGKRAAANLDHGFGVKPGQLDDKAAKNDVRLLSFNASSVHRSMPAQPAQLAVYERTLDREDTASIAPDQAQEESNRCFNCGCVATSPSDTAPALVALDATIRTTKRAVPAGTFFSPGVMKSTVLELGEIVTGIEIPELKPGCKQAFLKFSVRGTIDFPIVSVASVLNIEAGKVREAKIVLAGVAPVPWRSRAAEQALVGKPVTDESAAAAGEAAISEAVPLSDNKYLTRIVSTMVKRAILASRKPAGPG